MNSDRPFSIWIWFILGALAPTLLILGPLFSTPDVLAFRDVQHYYSPMLRMIHAQWQTGEIPVWNPLEERGRPLLADPTAAVWYPGQLLFRLPFDFDVRLKLYLAGHVLLAYAAAFWCARRLRIQPAGSALASCSYAFGGAIVFQCCNPPYLISAAWLPIGLVAVYELVTKPSSTARILLVGVLTMSVLGGDPQMGLLLGLASLVIVAMSWWQVRQVRRAWLGSAHAIGRLSLAATIAIGITSVQWLPTVVWAAQSDRVAILPDTMLDVSTAGWLPLDHEANRYAFSIGPWRWCELFWPNVAGKPFPQNTRWMDLIPAEARYWSPTLYMGILPMLFAVAALRLRRGRLLDRWLTWIALGGILACLGVYGVGWFVNQLWFPLSGRRLPIHDETGGLYWLITQLIPGFGLFRYPAKLWTWVALAFSLLAGQQLDDRMRQGRPPLPKQFVRGYLVTSLLLALLVWCGGSAAATLASRWSGNSLFGPFQPRAALSIATMGIAQGLLVVTALAILHASKLLGVGKWLGVCVVTWTSLDLAIAHQWLLPTAPDPDIVRDLEVEEQHRILRRQPRGWYPTSWSKTTSPNRLADCLQWESASAKPKYPELRGSDSLGSATSFSSIDQIALLLHLARLEGRAGHPFASALERLGVDSYYGLPSDKELGLLGPLTGHESFPRDLAIWKTQSPLPNVWLSSRFLRLDPLRTRSVSTRVERTASILRQSRDDFLDRVVLEATEGLIEHAMTNDTTPMPSVTGTSVRVTKRTASRLHVQVSTAEPAWLVVNESFAPGWSARRRAGTTAAITHVFRANRVMRSVYVPAGRHEIEFSYQPASLAWGASISVLTLLGLAGWMIGSVAGRWRSNSIVHRGI